MAILIRLCHKVVVCIVHDSGHLSQSIDSSDEALTQVIEQNGSITIPIDNQGAITFAVIAEPCDSTQRISFPNQPIHPIIGERRSVPVPISARYQVAHGII